MRYAISAGRRSCVRKPFKQAADSRHCDALAMGSIKFRDVLAIDVGIFVAAAGQIHDEDLIFGVRSARESLRESHGPIPAPE